MIGSMLLDGHTCLGWNILWRIRIRPATATPIETSTRPATEGAPLGGLQRYSQLQRLPAQLHYPLTDRTIVTAMTTAMITRLPCVAVSRPPTDENVLMSPLMRIATFNGTI